MKRPRSPWILAVTIIAVVAIAGLRLIWPWYQRRSAIEALKTAGVALEIYDDPPGWLSRFVDTDHMSGFPAVRRANFTDTDTNDVELAWLRELPEIESISLEYTHVTDAELRYLVPVRSLKYLSLRGTQTSDAGLSQLDGLPALETLSLRSTNVTDAGLAKLAKFRELQTLFVGMSETSPAGIETFRREHPRISVQW
jgi:hypothetical protein